MRRTLCRAVAALSVLGALAAAPGSPAHADSTFRFYGSGYGHGIGMSQWGAYGLAQMGWTHPQILRHFYRGTKVVTAGGLPGRIRVGLTSGRTTVHLRAQSGPVRLWVDQRVAGVSARSRRATRGR